MFSPLELHKTPLLYEEPASGVDLKEHGRDTHPILQTGSLPGEEGIRRRIALSALLCAEVSALAAISGRAAICVIFLLLGVSAITWIYCTESQTPGTTKRRGKLRTFLIAGTTIVACVIVTLLFMYRPHHGVIAQMSAPKSGGNHRAQKIGGGSDDSYAAVILWPEPPQEARVISPPPVARLITVTRLSKPLVIPFEGVYWYLRSPAKAPGRNAHIAHGNPTQIDAHSTDWRPLIMEAHQRLSSPIDPKCCRELDLAIRNADNRPGSIRIAVELIDASSSHVQSEDLGSQPVLSSMPPESPGDPSPTTARKRPRKSL